MMNIRLAIVLILTTCPAWAETSRAIMLDDDPSFCTMFYYLNGGNVPGECLNRPKKRGGIQKPKLPPITEPTPISFSKVIHFEFDSAQLSPKAMTTLDELSRIYLHEMMQGKTLRLEGHTDSVGSDAYNRRLSLRRALAAKQYLVNRGVGEQRISAAGLSFSKLCDPDHPEDGINRRTEVNPLSQ